MIKKILLHALIITIGIGLTKAQSRVNYQFGLKFGGTMSHFIEKDTKNDYWSSYVVGLSMEQRFTKRFSISYDVTYSKQGNMVFLTNPGIFNRVRTKYDYLNIPISLRYQVKKYPIIIMPGLQISHLIDNQTYFLPKNGFTNGNEPNIKKTDIGYSLGLGTRFGQHFFAEAKYYQSLKTLFKEFNGIDPITGNYVRTVPTKRLNEVLSVSLTYYILKPIKETAR